MGLTVTVLGFSGAAPLAGACPSYVVSDGDHTVLLDCGPGTLERLWRFRLLTELDAVVISHMHVDHVLDLVLIAGEVTRAMLGPERPALYLPTGGVDVLRRLDGATSGSVSETTRFHEAFELAEYRPEERLSVGGLRLDFAATAHRGLCCAARVSDGRVAVVYGADGSPSDAVASLAANADLLILEATYADDEASAAAQGHMTARQAGELAHGARAKRLMLTHLLPGNHENLRVLAEEAFHGPVDLAREGLTVDLS
jgi:ribonuclease BN (tRNA processing enzyme)